MKNMQKAVFLDRDGVINRKAPEGEYVTCWEQMDFFPGAAHAIALLNRAGFRVIVISNQRCVAKGLITRTGVERLHDRMRHALSLAGAIVDAIYYCPHEKDDHCHCRKPQPGMLLRAKQEHGIDLAASWMIGDSETDVEAGRSAGCRTARLLQDAPETGSRADLFATFLLEATRKILELERREQEKPVGERRYA
jgi:D-glycero-D-manno-heptose 1,7-bisphosphate phosphatase